jgi:hypothetical protein
MAKTKKNFRMNSAASLLTVTVFLISVDANICIPLAARPSVSPLIIKPDYDEFPVRLRCILVLDAPGRNTHVWQLLTKNDPSPAWVVYGSLYSPRLRKLISTYPTGTFIGRETRSSDPVHAIGQKLNANEIRDEREMKDFGDYCKVHGLQFGMLPVA